MFHVKPIDPRLLRYARATRHFLIVVVLLGLVGAALVIAQAMLIADVVVGAFERGSPRPVWRRRWHSWRRSRSDGRSSPG